MMKETNELIGQHVIYYDYIGIECYGIIVAIEPFSEDEVLIYIEDEDSEDNIHNDIVNGINIRYAEIRRSSEIYLDNEKGN